MGGVTYGYHGDDGKAFTWADNPNPSTVSNEYNLGITYGDGDILGCGVDLVNDTIFFTKNGKSLGMNLSIQRLRCKQTC